nr:MAG TPA: Protein of unknown function (DUF1492) [Caudoviricetes sp.]
MIVSKEKYKELKRIAESKLRAYPYHKFSDKNDKSVEFIEFVMERLDETSKEIIKMSYFIDDVPKNKILNDLNISNACYYRKKRRALEKFIIGLSY